MRIDYVSPNEIIYKAQVVTNIHVVLDTQIGL